MGDQGLNYKRECDETDYELISKLMNWTLNGGDIGTSEIDWFLQNEWKLFLLRKRKEIKLNLYDINRDYHSLSELVVFKVVKNKRTRWLASAKRHDCSGGVVSY